MENYINDNKLKDDNFSQQLSFMESPKQDIKSTLFNNKNKDKEMFITDNLNINKKYFSRRSLTPDIGNFLLNKIGYIKKEIKHETKKNVLEENKKKARRFSTPFIKDFVGNLLVNGEIKNDSKTNNNRYNQNIGIQEKSSTPHKNYFRRKSVSIKRSKKSYDIKNNLEKIIENNDDNKDNKTLEIYNAINNDFKQSVKNKYSLSFGDVDEENNEESSNDDNNNDSSYISKIESKHVSMYDIDEDLKELKEIGNNIKSPSIPIIRNNNKETKLISSFSINNYDNDIDNNDNNNPSSILFQLKKMQSQNINENKIINNPIVFDDKLELSFHEDLNKKFNKVQNNNIEIENIISYNNDINNIKKFNVLNDDKFSVFYFENLKNKKFCFFYKNDINLVKKINTNFNLAISEIEKIRKKQNNINDNNNIDDLVPNYYCRRYSQKSNKSYNSNLTDKNNNEINNKNLRNITNPKNKTCKRTEFTYSNKNNQQKQKEEKEQKFIEELPDNLNNNLTHILITNDNSNSLKNNYFLNNANELNQLIKEKLNLLSNRNSPNIQQFNYSKNILKYKDDMNKEQNKINLNFINNSQNSHKDQSFYNNDLFMSRENNIFCLGGEKSNNNITYNRYYNGNNITMNNFYNNYKLNDLNLNNTNNINSYNNKDLNINESEENDLVFNKNIKNIYNEKNNDINIIKNKLAIKLKEEIKKHKKGNQYIFDKKDKQRFIYSNYYNQNEDEKCNKCSSLEDLNIKKYIGENNKNLINGFNNTVRGISLNKSLMKYSSMINNENNYQRYINNLIHLNKYYEDINSEGDETNKIIFKELNNSNYHKSINSNLNSKLNPIKELKFNSKNKKINLKSSSISINKNRKIKNDYNIIKENICSRKHLLNNNKKKDTNKTQKTKSNYKKIDKSKINIDKNKNPKNFENISYTNKTLFVKNNYNLDKSKNKNLKNKDINNKNNTEKVYNFTNKSFYSSTTKNNKDNVNKTVGNINKEISPYNNKYLYGETKINNIIPNEKSEKFKVNKNKNTYFRNYDEKHSLYITKCNNSKLNIALKEFNSTLRQIECINKSKSKNKNSLKNKKIMHKNDGKKNNINKGKISNK